MQKDRNEKVAEDDARQPVPGEGTRPETVINDNNFFQYEDRL